MVLHLVRHACAGQKGEWIGPDDERPLDPMGVQQADALRGALAATPVSSLRASPTRRCVQTLEPLATALGMEVVVDERLVTDVPPEELLAALTDPVLVGAVLCTHGEAMGAVLPRLRAGGATVSPHGTSDEELLSKGTAWRLEVDHATGRVVHLDHVRPLPDAECVAHRERSAAGSPRA